MDAQVVEGVNSAEAAPKTRTSKLSTGATSKLATQRRDRRDGYRAGVAEYKRAKHEQTKLEVPALGTVSAAFLGGWTLGLETAQRMDSWLPHQIADRAFNEWQQAAEKHPPMRSAHEGIAVIEEELHELRLEVYKREPDDEALMREALQIAAMALRFVADICAPEVES